MAPPRAAGRPAKAPAGKAGRSPVAFFGAAAGLVLVLVVLAVVVLVTRRGDDRSAPQVPAAAQMGRPAGSGLSPGSYSSSPSTEVFEPIDQRSADRAPLTVAELFADRTISDSGSKAKLTLQSTRLDRDCAKAMWGSLAGNVLRKGLCTQAARAYYLDKKKGYAVTIGVFNLAGSADADRAVETFGPAGFVKPLPGAEPGEGFSVARGLAMGHFAVITWVRRLDGGGDEQDEALLSLLVTGTKAEAIYGRAAA
ncbi:MAG: hypothetical protein ABIS86_02375 [Streptosporangiaceae bacterium]